MPEADGSRKRKRDEEEPKRTNKRTPFLSFKTKLSYAISRSDYRRVVRILLTFPAGRKGVFNEISLQVKKEIRQYTNQMPYKDLCMEDFEKFRWTEMLEDVEPHAPLLKCFIDASVCMEKRYALQRRGVLLCVIAYHACKKKCKLVQSLISLEMWRNGCKNKMFQCLRNLGLCVGSETTRKTVDCIREGCCDQLLIWKRQAEGDMAIMEKIPGDQKGAELKDNSAEGELSDEEMEASEHESQVSDSGDSETSSTKSSGYTFSWDNVQKLVISRNQADNKFEGNKMLLWALCFATKNRVSEVFIADEDTIPAREIPIQAFLPTTTDFTHLRQRMVLVVEDIIVNHIPFFKENYTECLRGPKEYRFWFESCRKSNIVNMGVISTNPSSTSGVIKVLEFLHKFVTQRQDGTWAKTVCFGDVGSCERHTDARESRAAAKSSSGRLEALEPAAQDFHRRMLHMRDTMDEFFDINSVGDRGTLYDIKQAFDFKSVKKNTDECFNHAQEFMAYVTIGYVCLMAMSLLEMSKLQDIPCQCTSFTSMHDRQTHLRSLATRVVNLVWHDNCGDVATILDVLDEATGLDEEQVDSFHDNDSEDEEGAVASRYCFCKKGLTSTMVSCSNLGCPNGRWFHLQCVGLSDGDIPEGDWRCGSDDCKNASIFCWCRQTTEKALSFHCSSKLSCLNGEYFHADCVGDVDIKKPGRWYCHPKCQHQKKTRKDHVFNYTTAVMWRGLREMVRKDWRIEMLDYFRRNHTKYRIVGHRLLAGCAGWLPTEVAVDLKWNRTVNIRGQPGSNLEMDLVNEFLNREFKEMLKGSHGHYTEATVERCSQMSGTIGHTLDAIFQVSTAGTYVHHPSGKSPAMDIADFVEEYASDHLVTYEGARQHSNFPKFVHDAPFTSDKAKGIVGFLCKYSRKLDTQTNNRPRQ